MTDQQSACVNCGAVLVAEQRFCRRCGTPTASTGAPGAPPGQPPPGQPPTGQPPTGSSLAPTPTVLPVPEPPPVPEPVPAPVTMTPAPGVSAAPPGVSPTMAAPPGARPPAPPDSRSVPPGPPQQPPRRGRAGVVLLAVVATLALVGLLGGGYLLLGRDDGDDTAADHSGGRKPWDAKEAGAEDPAQTGSASATAGGSGAAGKRAGDPDPLDIGIDMTNQDCTGKYLVMYGTAGEHEPGKPAASWLRPKLQEAGPGAKYLRAVDSCRDTWPKPSNVHGDIYQVYLGPFDTLASACRTRRAGVKHSWVNRLGKEPKAFCVCIDTAAQRPVSQGTADPEGSYAVSDAKQILFKEYGRTVMPAEDVGGQFTDALVTALEHHQRQNGLAVTGALDKATWESLLATADCES